MLAVVRILVPSILSVAARTHIASVVLPLGVRALSNEHYILSLATLLLWTFFQFGGGRGNWRGRVWEVVVDHFGASLRFHPQLAIFLIQRISALISPVVQGLALSIEILLLLVFEKVLEQKRVDLAGRLLAGTVFEETGERLKYLVDEIRVLVEVGAWSEREVLIRRLLYLIFAILFWYKYSAK